MDRIEKLFRKISKTDRMTLKSFSDDLQIPSVRKNLDIKKLEGSDFYRAKKGKFRIIFHLEGSAVVIDSIRLRNEKTYRDI